MSIRLNKAIRELNIGLQTAVEFLRKRSDLGEVKEELSFKLSDSQYNALVEAFKSDKEVRSQAEKLLLKHPKEKKRQSDGNKERRADNAVRSVKPQKYTPLGKIDLDSLGKKPAAKPAAPAEKPQEAAVAEQPKPEVKESAAATVQAKSQEPKPEQPVAAAEKKPAEPAQPAGNTTAVVEEKKTEPEKVQPEAKPEAKAAEPQAQQPAAPEKPAEPEPVKEESKIFTLKSEKKLAPKVNVLGKIDLDSLNQSTRPKKKTKEERRKEREEKAMQAHPDGKKKTFAHNKGARKHRPGR